MICGISHWKTLVQNFHLVIGGFARFFKMSTYIQCKYSDDRMIQNLVPVRFKDSHFYGLNTLKFEPKKNKS